jgi:HAMP domain-containing protein
MEIMQEQSFFQAYHPAVLKRAARRRIGLKGKIIGGLVSCVLLFGLLVLAVVNHQMGRALRTQLDRRALDITSNLGDAAAAHMLRGNVLELYAMVTKYSFLSGVAYTFIKDQKGGILAHSLGAFPSELSESLVASDQREPNQRELMFRGRRVYETRAPILEGRVGAVYVGIWADTVASEIQQALLPVGWLIVAAVAAGVVFSIVIAQGIIERVLRLKEMADKVSMGDLETPVGVETNDEIGDLARSLERMRSSLKAAMMRLGSVG